MRPGLPQDKAKLEVSVQVVERRILARLRHQRCCTLAELNAAIGLLLAELSQRPFKKLPGCRRSAFEALDVPSLKPLPAAAVVLARFKPARVNIGYHIAFGHLYNLGRSACYAQPPAHAPMQKRIDGVSLTGSRPKPCNRAALHS